MSAFGAATSDPPSAPPEASSATSRLAPGVELMGRYAGSEAGERYLARRGDGQVMLLPRMLYLTAAALSESRGPAEVALLVSAELGRTLAPEQVEYLVEQKLRPLGLIADRRPARPPDRSDPLLGLKNRVRVVPARIVDAIAGVLSPLFLPPLVIGVVAAFAALDGWLIATHQLAPAFTELAFQPLLALVVQGLVAASLAFHELGHAAACRYGGARPGAIGIGLYLVWPVFFTDANDSYRLGRMGRLRVDLGGLYFNALFCVVIGGAYWTSGFRPLVAALVIMQLDMLMQFAPWVRLDGYYVVADLVGVPDLFSRIRPALASLRPARRAATAERLPRGVRRAVLIWTGSVAAVGGGLLWIVLSRAQQIVFVLHDTVLLQLVRLVRALDGGSVIAGVVAGAQLSMIVLGVIGLVVTLGEAAVRALHLILRIVSARRLATRRLNLARFRVGAFLVAALGFAVALASTAAGVRPLGISAGALDPTRFRRPSTVGDGLGPAPSLSPALLRSAAAAGCSVAAYPSAGRSHTTRPVDYRELPPTSGPHYPVWAPWGVYDRPVPFRLQVHNLEHGGVIFHLGAALAAPVRTEIRRFWESSPAYLILTPDDAPRVPPRGVMVTSWQRSMTCPRLGDQTLPALREYRDVYRGTGPEQIEAFDPPAAAPLGVMPAVPDPGAAAIP